MRIVSSLALAALAFGAPVLTSDLGLFDGSAHAKSHKEMPSKSRGAEMRASAGGKGADKSAGRRSVNASLKGVNSLNRNVNGLMNSNDAKMDGFRAFVMASVAYEDALEVLDDARSAYEPLAMDYRDLLAPLMLAVPNTTADWNALETTLAALGDAPRPEEADYMIETEVEVASDVEGEGAVTETRMVLDEDAYAEALSEWNAQTAAASAAQEAYDATRSAWLAYAVAYADAEDKEDAASEGTMIEAIVAALNATGAGPVSEDDISDEMVAWVSARMGVGEDLDGLIDAYRSISGN